MKLCKFLISFFLIGIVINCSNIISYAEKPNIKVTNGDVSFTTTDTTATTSTKWKTVGFTITRVDSRGNPTDVPHARLALKQEWKQEYVDNSGKTSVIFNIPEASVSQALIKAGFDAIKDHDTIYISCIHQVMHGSTEGATFSTLSGIRNAEFWKNPNDFDDRFDIPVTYNAIESPITIRYITADGKTISESAQPKIKPGELTTVHFDNTITYGGQILYLSKSYVCYKATGARITGTTNYVTSVNASDYENQLPSVRTRSKMQVIGGLQFVAVMRPRASVKNKTTEDYSSLEVETPIPHGVIAADDRENEQYDVTEGIPTTENLYTNVFSSRYILGYKLARVYGSKYYNVQAKKTYTLTWTETNKKTGKSTPKSETKTVLQLVMIRRDFSYWKIMNIEYYGINYATISNYALPGGQVTLMPQNYSVPTLTYEHSAYMTDHIKEPDYDEIMILPSETKNGGNTKPSVPNEDFTSYVDDKINKIRVRNDRFTFGGTNITDNNYVKEITDAPLDIDVDYSDIEDDVLYNSGLTIEANKENGVNNTTGTVVYKPICTINSRLNAKLSYSINDLNQVVIHTPTVCDATIESKIGNNQMIYPDTSMASLVLDTKFNINLPTSGEHRYILGYEYRDYGKYISSRQVQFPFDVYNNSTYIRAGTWFNLSADTTQFYLPTWVNEGKYTIHFRSPSINAFSNAGLNKAEALANLDYNNYVATDTIHVEVSGRIYGFNLYDISDYPTWRNVFRIPNSLRRTAFKYTVGDKDQNGKNNKQNPKYTLSLVNGVHPEYSTIGAIKAGYLTRFSLTTVGNMYSENDYIRIKPTFYYVDMHGQNRQEVDIYYSESFHNVKQIMVKMGSELDLVNKKSLRIGDPYLGVPEEELLTTASIKGITLNRLMAVNKNIYTYMNIMIPESLRTYAGSTNNLPTGITETMAARSVQNWYGEYYLPSEIHVVPKGYDLYEYVKKNGCLNYKENFWLTKGYVIVNYQIESIQDGMRHLSYINADNASYGYCNMWKTEGYAYKKVDNKGNIFKFIDGDYVLYYTDNSVAEDYISAGTH